MSCTVDGLLVPLGDRRFHRSNRMTASRTPVLTDAAVGQRAQVLRQLGLRVRAMTLTRLQRLAKPGPAQRAAVLRSRNIQARAMKLWAGTANAAQGQGDERGDGWGHVGVLPTE